MEYGNITFGIIDVSNSRQCLVANESISFLIVCSRFIAAEDSPNNKPLLVVSGSVSGTITVLQINVAGMPILLALL